MKRKRTKLKGETLNALSTARPNSKAITWEETVNKFTDYLRITEHSRHTIDTYSKTLAQIQRDLAKLDRQPHMLATITESDIEALIRHYLDERRLKASTINQRLRTLSTLYEFAIKKKYVTANIVKKVGYLKERHTVPDVLSADDLQTVLNSIDPAESFNALTDYTLVMLLAETGVRITEACALTVENVDLTKRVLTVSYAKNRQPRLIPLSKRLEPVLRLYLSERGVLETSALLVNGFSEPMTRRNCQARIAVLAEKSGVRITAHMCRRYFATSRLQKGVDVWTVAKLMGHSDLQSLKRYLSTDEDTLRKGVDL